MVWLSERERLVLTALGLLVLVGLGARIWQQRRPPITVEQGARPPTAQWEAMIQQARQVDLNQATTAELERLPEIGPSMAQRIIEYRQTHGRFERPTDLLNVPGIGPKTFEVLRDYVTVN